MCGVCVGGLHVGLKAMACGLWVQQRRIMALR
jgi:hypothetical protein